MRVGTAEFISRSVGKSKGWLVRITTAGRPVRKFFSDSVHGGEAMARRVAEEFRDRTLLAVLFWKVLQSDGLHVFPCKRQWYVPWVDLDGMHRRTYFSTLEEAEGFARHKLIAVREARYNAVLKQRQLC